MQHFPQYEIIAKRILDLIEKGNIAPGDKLPTERALAKRFRVSRNCIRESLRTLTEAGIVRSRRGDGTYYEGHNSTDIAQQIGLAVNRHKERIDEIFELRRMLEPSIAAKAAERISKEQLAILKTLVFDQHRAVLENRDDSAEDQRFHRILAESINNRAVLDVLDVVDNLLNNTRSAPLRDAQRGLASVKGHMRIVDALERHDANEARNTMQSHLEEVRQKALK